VRRFRSQLLLHARDGEERRRHEFGFSRTRFGRVEKIGWHANDSGVATKMTAVRVQAGLFGG